MRNAIPVRRGYAMALVLMFIVLFLAMLGVVCRELAGALRIESLHSLEVQRDKGSVRPWPGRWPCWKPDCRRRTLTRAS